MKTLDLNNYGVQEMNAVEMKEANGGWKLFGTEAVNGFAVVDPVYGFGIITTVNTYAFGILISSHQEIRYYN